MIVFVFVTFTSLSSNAQNQVLLNRLCQSWSLVKINNVTTNTTEQAPSNFKLIIHQGNQLEQGLFPEGMIQSNWILDEKSMMLRITDVKTQFHYDLKIVRITSEELELEDNNNELVIVYYRRDKE